MQMERISRYDVIYHISTCADSLLHILFLAGPEQRRGEQLNNTDGEVGWWSG